MARGLAVAILASVALVSSPMAAHAADWPDATTLSAAGESASGPQVAVDGDGTVTVVWYRSDGDYDRVQAATRPVGGSWSSPVTLSVTGHDADAPQIAVDAAGSATVVWSLSDGGHYRVQAATRPAGGAWGSPVNLSAAGQDALSPQIAAGDDGAVTVTWNSYVAGGYGVQAATRSVAGVWGSPADLSGPGVEAFAPEIAVGADGTATVTWIRDEEPNGSWVQAATRPPAGAWSSPVDLISGVASGEEASGAQVAAGADGTASVVWTQIAGSSYWIQAATRSAAGIWSSPVDLSEPGLNAHDPQVAIGPDGVTTATWRRSDASKFRVQAVTRPSSGAWSSPVDLSGPGQNASGPQLAIGPDGATTVTWPRFDGTDYRVQAVTRPSSGAWDSPVDLSEAGQNALDPQVASGSDGTFGVVWRRYDGHDDRVQAVVVDRVDEPSSPPTTVKSASRVKVKAKPKRDRKAPYKFTFRGKVTSAVPATCSGTVGLVVKRGKKTVAKKRTTLNPSCNFTKKVKIKRKALPKSGKARLKVTAVYSGNTTLTASRGTTKIRVG